ncbi:MAG: tRNA lysidine(34) synthetase TilS [Patescibacteria group bacterium]
MELVLPTPDSYVVAVSGGVDSMALLDMLHQESLQNRNWKLVVAHLDHGIRSDSEEDLRLVESVARGHGLPFVAHSVSLGAGASEASARKARYDFLNSVVVASGAQGVITAHHQDDVLETAIINMLRGSGRKGLTSLSSRPDVVRPLLNVPKSELVEYAMSRNLDWREDSTNSDDTYLRNYVRLRLLPRFNEETRAELLGHINDARYTNAELDTLLVNQLASQSYEGDLDRAWFNNLPHAVAREVMASWLRANDIAGFDSKGLERLVVAAKVSSPGKSHPVLAGTRMEVFGDHLALARSER